ESLRSFNEGGRPVWISPEFVFDLDVSSTKPGLRLSRTELKEMVGRIRFGQKRCESIWNLCSGHIGISYAMLKFLNNAFGSDDPINAGKIESVLRSVKLLENICRTGEGAPSPEAICKMIPSPLRVEHALDDLGRPEPVAPIVTSLAQRDFVQVYVKRMCSCRLRMMASKHLTNVAQEGMKLYRTIVSCLPKGKDKVSPECSSVNGN
ncbi:hypothetical protein GN958_ATG17210, partial [Phytophthora infestans]